MDIKAIQHKPVRWHGVENCTREFMDAVVPLLSLTIELTKPPL